MISKEKILDFVKKHKIAVAAGSVFLAMIVFVVSSIFYQVGGLGSDRSMPSMISMSPISSGYSEEASYDKVSNVSKRMALETDGAYNENTERKIIRNGNLSLIVKDIEVTKKDVKKITEKFGGFIQSSNFSENEYKNYSNRYSDIRDVVSRSGQYEVKIPSKNFSQAFEAYKKVALKIENESVSASDVTEQYTDLETQIRNKKAEEDQYRILLERSGKISEVLEVTKYLNKAMLERERLQGRLNYLSNQVELSSIRINIIAEKDVEMLGIVWSPIKEIKASFRNLLEDTKDLANSTISFVFKLPILLIWLFIIVFGFKFGWMILLKSKEKIFGNKK